VNGTEASPGGGAERDDELEVMSEDDYLSIGRELSEALCHVPAPDMVQRAHRIIKDQSRFARIEVGLAKEAGETEGGLLALAEDLAHGLRERGPKQLGALAEFAFLAASRRQPDAFEMKSVGLPREPISHFFGDVFSVSSVAFLVMPLVSVSRLAASRPSRAPSREISDSNLARWSASALEPSISFLCAAI
jgi:hypothetical protein